MKTEQRHELKKNELTEVLKKIEPYWRAIVGVCVVLVTVVVAAAFLSASQKKAREAGWASFFSAAANGDLVALESLANSQKGSTVAPWAQYSAAQGKLIEGSAAMASDRVAAKQSLQEAVEGFQKAIEQAGNYELIEESALWGLGRAHENLDELSTAKKYYKEIVDKWPGSAIAERAQARIDSLNDPATLEFYKWYFAQTPPAARLPASGEVPGLPFGQLPSEPDVSIPNPVGSDGGSSDRSSIDLQLPYSNTEEDGGESDGGLEDGDAEDTTIPNQDNDTEDDSEDLSSTQQLELLEDIVRELSNYIEFVDTMLDLDKREDLDLNYDALLFAVAESEESPLAQKLTQRYGRDHPLMLAMTEALAARDSLKDTDDSAKHSSSANNVAKTMLLEYVRALKDSLKLSQSDLASFKQNRDAKREQEPSVGDSSATIESAGTSA